MKQFEIMKDYYYILGIPTDANLEEIKKTYRKLSLKFHPDKNNGDNFFSERFKEIQEAYEILKDNNKRSNYDFKRNLFYTSNNLNPVIEYFESNKLEFSFNDMIALSWKTKNADKVYIKPFGCVDSIGTKTIIAKNTVKENLTFELVAENSISGQFVTNKLILKYKKVFEQKSKELNKTIKQEKKDYSFFKMILINAILKPIIVFGIIILIIYLIFRQ